MYNQGVGLYPESESPSKARLQLRLHASAINRTVQAQTENVSVYMNNVMITFIRHASSQLVGGAIQTRNRRAFSTAHTCPTDLDLPKFNHFVPCGQLRVGMTKFGDNRTWIGCRLLVHKHISIYKLPTYTDAGENITSPHLGGGCNNWLSYNTCCKVNGRGKNSHIRPWTNLDTVSNVSD